jgi:signal transduction histidine kinase/CheY-like chemotaxis protein
LDLRNDVTALFRVLPAAKYVIFLPFFHFQRSCWYTCAIGWIEDPARAVGVADIGLVSAFGNSVMAEISRLEAVAASRAKSDFVSSLSHELRSPLHGIMASSELIREAISDRSILSLLDLLDSCSQTALDTFENLLDHAIVAHAGHGSAFNSSHMRQVDLGSMVEDVVEAVRAGHLSGNVFHSQTSSGRKRGAYLTGPTDAAHDLPDRPLLITVQVAKYPWRLTVNVGAWKRIVMNLFGNALKYTNTGRIDVGLNVVKRTDRMGHPQPYISFTVGDTGSGMSADYLKYHLFTPFLQEDSHAPGVGLGLSIVRKLVSDLGGVVNVKSSLGIGTLVEVLVPLGAAVSDSLPADEQQPLHDQFSGLDGRTVCLVGPDAFAALADTEFEITKEVRSWSEIVENALRAIAGSGMEVILGTKDCPAPKADLYVLDSSLFGSTVEERRDTILQKCRERASPLVLLCSGSKTSSCVGHGIKSHDIHLHHPIGPRKLASVFRSALEAKPVGGMVQTRTDEKRYPDNSAKDQSSSPPRTITPKGPALLAPQPPPPESSSKNMKSVTEIPASTGAQSEVPSTKSRHLLLVDDNLINISLLTRLVRKLNHTFETASNGLEAVQRYKSSLEGQSKRFDIIFMDISMPVMNGFEATREIRQLETKAGLSRCRVIALTGLSSEVNRSEANASGVDAFYTKPVRMDTIKGILDEDRPEASPG